MLTISAQHLALDPFSKFSLSTEFSTCFVNILDCVRAIQGKDEKNMKRSVVSREQQEILNLAVTWLPPSMRQVLARMGESSSSDYDDDGSGSMRVNGSI